MSQPCPRCKKPSEQLVPVDTALKVALAATGDGSSLPGIVCADCYSELTSQFSQGLKLRIEKEQKEKNKLMMWKSRVNLIKQARNLMTQKAYSEAAVAYEKYLRVLEMVYNVNKGGLTPEVFNNSKRSKELTVVASVYWDLFRIYDTSPRYGDRMAQSATKLAQFLPFSPIFPDVAKKIEAFGRSAKNPNIVRNLQKSLRMGRGKCFIATAVIGCHDAEELEILRQFRDEVLLADPRGLGFVFWYYKKSPPIANWIESHAWAKAPLRPIIKFAALAAKKSLNSRPQSYNS